MGFLNMDILGEKVLFENNYIGPIDIEKFSNSSKRDKEGYLIALSVSFLRATLTLHSKLQDLVIM
jgi:hypothetical protein